MSSQYHKILKDLDIIDQDQFNKLDIIESKRLVSLFGELKTLLYLGVLLFSSGVGLLVYQNAGQFGHVISLVLIVGGIGACLWYVYKNEPEYSTGKVESPTPYFDYLLLLASLLLVTFFAYIEFLTNLLGSFREGYSLITAVIFFYFAYRYDHIGLLSLGISAFVSFFGIALSPKDWVISGSFFTQELFIRGTFISLGLITAGLMLNQYKLKEHFTFSFMNYGSLIYFVSALCGLCDKNYTWIYLVLLLAGAAGSWYYAQKSKSFLFLIYSFITAYIGTTYLLIRIIDVFNQDAFILWFFYSICSCGGFVFFIIKYKDYYNEQE